ncbi:MAG: STAS domain-containing protein [Oscillochloris sp.]|nr:STAS domain-containing protein [Oscillochloris sp.]
MESTLEALIPQIEAAIATALRQNLMTNRGSFAPFRVGSTAKDIARAIAEQSLAEIEALGQALGRDGLSLASLTATQAATLGVVAQTAAPAQPGTLIALVSNAFGALITGQSSAHIDEIQRQRDEIERAFRKVIAEQQEQEFRLRDAIRELSTPIIPVYEGVLVLPLVGAIDSRRATEITERLLDAISTYQADMVILDITGVSVIDTSIANHLLMTTRAASLLGSRVILTGLGPEVAQSVIHLGVDLHTLVTLANLRSGLEYALAQLGLGIQPLPGVERHRTIRSIGDLRLSRRN